jgi:2-polyprenyl-6-methoxyphenol hydroxylase-like FAD-dependent oxidoreductase
LDNGVELECELLVLEQNNDGLMVRLAGKTGQETFRVRYLIGADGSYSLMRHAIISPPVL